MDYLLISKLPDKYIAFNTYILKVIFNTTLKQLIFEITHAHI